MKIENKSFLGKIGMFDQIKGMGLILVIFSHSFSTGLVSFQPNPLAIIFAVLLSCIGVSIMPAFFVISAYGFRKKKITRCFIEQCRLILKPYLLTIIAVTFLHFISRYLYVFHSLKKSFFATLQVTMGFILALPDAIQIKGVTIYSCGAMWYMISLFIGWIILDAIMQFFPEKWWTFVVCVVTLIGWLIGLDRVSFFCISQGLISVLFLYMGFKGKKEGFYKNDWLMRYWYIAAFMWLVSLIKVVTLGGDGMAGGNWTAGPFGIVLDGMLGMSLVYFFVRINWKDGKVGKFLGIIGSNSLYVLAAHTVEFHGMPWYLLAERYGETHPYLVCLVIFLLRSFMIFFMIIIIKRINKIWKMLRRKEYVCVN